MKQSVLTKKHLVMSKGYITNSDNRINWVDYAKGIGIILVVYGHVIRGLYGSGIINKDFYYYSDTFVYSFHMPLFFILSGYFFPHSIKKRWATFTTNKIQTLIYPFIVWSIIQTIIEVLLSNYTNNKVSSQALLECLIIPRAQFWFLYALFFINLLNYAFYILNKRYWLLLSLIISMIYFIFQPDLYAFTFTFKFLIFFNLGILLSELKNHFILFLANNKYLLLNITGFCAVEYLYFFTDLKSVNLYKELFNIILPISGSLLMIQLSEWANRKDVLKFLSYLGKGSLAIYLVHILVASGTRIILLKFTNIDNPVIHVILGTLAGIIFPLIIYAYGMKRPYLSWLFTYQK
jgi:fucose 4-O-acetylase-like acetyltransferase